MIEVNIYCLKNVFNLEELLLVIELRVKEDRS